MHRKEKNTPRVSVLMANYNGERFLASAIVSILEQSYKNFELIVIDDGSTDSSASIIRAFVSQDSRVKGFYFSRNRGFACALNYGLKFSRGEYVARMDSDDLCHRDRFQKQVAYLDKHTKIHVLGCRYRAINEEGTFCSTAYARRFMSPVPIVFGGHRVAKNILLGLYPVLHATIVCRRSTLLSVGGYREFFPIAEDDDLYFRLVSLHGEVLNNLPEKLYYYRHHGSSTTQRFSRPFRNLIFNVLTLSAEFRRRGFEDPLEVPPLPCYKSLRFRGVSSVLFLQDSLVFLPSSSRARMYSLLRVVMILRRFGLKSFHHISLRRDLGITLDRQIYFYASFCSLCFRVGKHRACFLYLRHILSLRYYVIFFEMFRILNHFSDNHLRFFRSLIFTRCFYYGLKHLVFAFYLISLRTTKFFASLGGLFSFFSKQKI